MTGSGLRDSVDVGSVWHGVVCADVLGLGDGEGGGGVGGVGGNGAAAA